MVNTLASSLVTFESIPLGSVANRADINTMSYSHTHLGLQTADLE